MEENMKVDLALDDLDKVSGGKELEEMSLEELNGLVRMYEQNFQRIYAHMGPEGGGSDVTQSMDATQDCLNQIKAVRKKRFGV